MSVKPTPITSSALSSLGAPFDGLRLSKDPSYPAWLQLFEQFTTLLNERKVVPGRQLPTERDLSQALGVSRSTVKRCYDELRQQQRLSGRGRAGSVVIEPVGRVHPNLGQLKGFTQEMHELGKTASTRVLVREVLQDRRVASLFGLPSNSLFLHTVRLRLGDAVPMTREVAWYDLSQAPAMVDWDGQGSAYDCLRLRCGLELDHAEQSIEAVISSTEETRAFGFKEPGPCLLLKRSTRTLQGVLVEYVEGTFRGDAYVYRMRLSA